MRVVQRECKELPHFGSNMPPLLQRIYAARGISSTEQLDKSLKKMLSFDALTDIDKACRRLEAALESKERILIIGDFDADGATSTALGVQALRKMGGASVEYLVPNRFQFGYGLTPGIVEVAKKWRPNVILTVDNGIASFEGVDAANLAGIDVIVTDHHLPSDHLPAAYAIVNPNRHGDDFESKSIAGVGVIFYLMMALRRHLINSGWFESQSLAPPNMADFLDLVALGTVADVVSLDHNNRILVSQGLARIRQGLCRPGIQALVEIAGRSCKRLRESDLGFAVAPRLNAAGRLDDMSLGIECLLASEASQAQILAEELNELNAERRQIEAEMKEQALAAINQLLSKMDEKNKNQFPQALCLFDESWHQGVIGILAGRLKERYQRPVIVFSLGGEDEIKGSCRSIPSLNIRDVLAAVDKDNPGLIRKFGGHAMAAGLSLARGNFQAFKEAFVAETARHINLTDCEGTLYSDGALSAEELTIEMAEVLQQAGPWGQQFPEPCFDNEFEVLAQRLVGQHHLKLTLAHPKDSGSKPIDAIAFNVDLNAWPNHRAKKIYAVYKLDINVYQERAKLQLMVEGMKAVE